MPRRIETHLVPALFAETDLAGGIAVVIDILRASSTITTALANGARFVEPCLTVEEAFAARGEPDGVSCLLGGERGGLQIPGFDLGNSPLDYTAERVQNRRIVFTTTNGTRALHRSRAAREVLIGCFLNRAELVSHLRSSEGDVHLVCAGTDGAVTLEDCLFAGVVARDLLQDQSPSEQISDSTRMVLALAESYGPGADEWRKGLHHSQGSRNLEQLGMMGDVGYCAQPDLFPIVPVWDPQTNRIILPAGKNA